MKRQRALAPISHLARLWRGSSRYARRQSAGLSLCGLLLLSVPGWSASLGLQHQQLLTQANSLSVAAILHFETDPRPGDSPDIFLMLETLNDAERQVQQLATRLALSSPGLDAMLISLTALYHIPAEQAMNYLVALVELLDQHQRLSQQLTDLYQQHSVVATAQLLNQQSQRIARLRLHALTRNAQCWGVTV